MNTSHKKHIYNLRKNENGNALVFVLIALVLIGLLTAVISRSGSSVEQTGSTEQARITASQVMRYAKGIEAAVTNMKLHGISESDISFEDSATGTTYQNTNCTDAYCLVFNSEGGGMTYQTPPAKAGSATDWIFTAANIVDDIGTTNTDLIMMLPNISESLCTQINKEVGHTTAGNDTGVAFTAFQGSYATEETLNFAERSSSGCLGHDNSGTTEYFYYHVLLAR